MPGFYVLSTLHQQIQLQPQQQRSKITAISTTTSTRNKNKPRYASTTNRIIHSGLQTDQEKSIQISSHPLSSTETTTTYVVIPSTTTSPAPAPAEGTSPLLFGSVSLNLLKDNRTHLDRQPVDR